MTNNFRILGFSDKRSDKLTKPLSTIEDAEVITGSGTTGLKKYPYLLKRGKRHIASKRPNVLVAQHPGRLGMTVLALGESEGIPVVIRIAGDLWRTNYNVLRENFIDKSFVPAAARLGQIGINSLITSRAQGYIVVSDELREIVAKRTGYLRKQIRNVPVTVDTTRFQDNSPEQACNQLGITTNRLLLTVTNLRFEDKLKGACDAIRAVIPILSTNSDITYTIAGGGKYLQNLRTYVDRVVPPTLQDRIVVPGYMSGIENLYAAADAFIYISYIDGYPNVVSEAMAAGLPIVANAAHGMLEQIDDGETGLLIDDPRGKNLTYSIERLLSDAQFADQLGTAAQQRVKIRNNSERVGQQLVDALKNIVNSHNYG